MRRLCTMTLVLLGMLCTPACGDDDGSPAPTDSGTSELDAQADSATPDAGTSDDGGTAIDGGDVADAGFDADGGIASDGGPSLTTQFCPEVAVPVSGCTSRCVYSPDVFGGATVLEHVAVDASGTRLAVLTQEGQLWVSDLDLDHSRLLADSDISLTSVAFHPSGAALYAGSDTGVQWVPVDGGARVAVTDWGTDVAVAPDGSALYVNDYRFALPVSGFPDSAMTTADATELVGYPVGGSRSAVSPSSSRLAAVSWSSLYLFSGTTHDLTVAHVLDPVPLADGVAWSSENTLIVSGTTGGNNSLYLLDVSGSAPAVSVVDWALVPGPFPVDSVSVGGTSVVVGTGFRVHVLSCALP